MDKKIETTPVVENDTTLTSGNREVEKEDKKASRKKSTGHEILRFVLVGVLCTVIDFGLQYLLMWLFRDNLSTIGGGYLAWAVATTCSFIIASIVNFIFSRRYVFQNVDKNIKTNNMKTFWVYFGLGAGGWVIGLGLQELGVYLCNVIWDMNLALDITKISWGDLITVGGLAFWAFVIIFCIKTCVVMIYNYITRKKIIFKAPKGDKAASEAKGDEVYVVNLDEDKKPASESAKSGEKKPADKKSEEKKSEETNASSKPLTPEQLRQIVHEELRTYYGKGDLIITESEAKQIVEEELDQYLADHPKKK